MAQLQNIRAQHQQQQMMQRGMNGERPRTPGGPDHAPSPSKRARLEGVPFNGPQIMPNGRPMPPGMPGQQMMQHNDPQAQHANQLLMNHGINPGNLSDTQFASFQQQNPSVQQKSIQVYAQNMTKHQGDKLKNASGMSDEGSPMMVPGMDLANADFFPGNPAAAQQMRNGGILPNGAPNGTGGNHALQDYQMQLMLLEQQNKKRLMMARQEQDITRPEGQPGIPGQAGFGAPGMSPQGSRGGPSPQPGDQARRGTPKMGQPGMPGSPMPDGRMTGSPAAINFNNMDPALYGAAHMNGRIQPPPSSNPAFNGGQMPPQQIEAMQRPQAGVRMPNGQWQQGPQGQAPMMQPGPPGQPNQMGTPQQRNDMPPPQGVPATTANGRPGSPAAQPTPQQSNKANPSKGKKDPKAKKPTKKSSTASVAPTPAADGENPAATPTPSTPITPQHQSSFAPGKSDGQSQANAIQNANAAAPSQVTPQPPDPNAVSFGNIEGADVSSQSLYASRLILTLYRAAITCNLTMTLTILIFLRTLTLNNSFRAMLSASEMLRLTPIQALKLQGWAIHDRVKPLDSMSSSTSRGSNIRRVSTSSRKCPYGITYVGLSLKSSKSCIVDKQNSGEHSNVSQYISQQ